MCGIRVIKPWQNVKNYGTCRRHAHNTLLHKITPNLVRWISDAHRNQKEKKIHTFWWKPVNASNFTTHLNCKDIFFLSRISFFIQTSIKTSNDGFRHNIISNHIYISNLTFWIYKQLENVKWKFKTRKKWHRLHSMLRELCTIME